MDDTGIYFIGIRNQEKTIITYYNFIDNSMQLVFQDSNLTNNITAIKTTSPGTQPLPNGRNDKIHNLLFISYTKLALMCLSPDFSNVNNRPYPRVKSNTTTSILLLWDDPEWPSNCNGMSRPPLLYRVYVKDLSGVYVKGYNPKVCGN